MSLTLCGFPASNYYNKVKLALLEKAIPFAEEFVFPSSKPAFLAASPRGKVPFIRVGDRTVWESQAIVEYLEETGPATPLYPADPLERAQSRAALQRSVRFGPYIGGHRFGLPDVAAVCHLPLVRNALRNIYGEDWLTGIPGLDDCLNMILLRPHVVTVKQARLAGMAPFIAAVKKNYGFA